MQLTEDQANFEFVSSLMKCELTPNPSRTVPQILQSNRRRRGLHLQLRQWGAIAAAVLLSIILCSMFVPGLTYALSRLPLFGTPYRYLVNVANLDVAYSAGLVTKLDRQVSSDGFTLHVMGAYSDPKVSAVMFKITGDDLVALQEWEKRGNIPLMNLRGLFGWHTTCSVSSYWYEKSDQAAYGTLRSDPAPWWAGSKWTAQLDTNGGPIFEISFPVRRVSEFTVPKVRVNQELVYKDMVIKVKSLAFYPSTTVLTFATESNDMPRWRLETSTGRSYYDSPTGNDKELRIVNFDPIEPQPLKLVMYDIIKLHDVILPAVQGSTDTSLGFLVTLDKLEKQGERVQVEVSHDAPPSFYSGSLALSGPGQPEDGSVRSDNSISRTFLVDGSLDGWQVFVYFDERVPVDEEVFLDINP